MVTELHVLTASPAPSRAVEEQGVWEALAEVPDPEIPVVSVVDLGLVRRVELGSERLRVEILPTFVGCPAIDMIRATIAERLAAFARDVAVDVSYAEPWTSDRITPEGRRKLRESGFAPPTPLGSGPQLIALLPVAQCPHCGSRRTQLENAFGPTACRAIHYCTACRQPFEQFKQV